MDDDLKLREAAQLLRVCPRTVRNYIKSGKLPAMQSHTGRWLIRRNDVERFKYGNQASES